MNDADPKYLVNSKKIEYWVNNFLKKLEDLAKSDKKEIELVLGDLKRKPRKYIVLKENLEKILEYVKYFRVVVNAKPSSIGTIAPILIHFADSVKKPFKEVKREDIEKFLEKNSTKSNFYMTTLKRIIKPFFRWLYGFKKNEGYPEVVSWIVIPNKNSLKSLPQILTMEEINKMIESCDNLRDKALISILYESGCRASEILDLKIKDLEFDEYGGVLIVRGKTGARRIRLISSIPALKEWLNVHPNKNDPNAPLFCSLAKRDKGAPLADSSLCFIVQQIAKRAGIAKRVYPHLFRHTRATHLAKYLTEQELKIYFGWAKGSDMPGVYVHLSGRDVENKILQISGVKPKESESLPTLPTIKCYRCGEENSSGNKFCWKCGAPLEQRTIEKIEAVKKIVSEITLYIFEKMKERKIGEEDLEEIVGEWLEKQNKD